jgi:hypothetical protein
MARIAMGSRPRLIKGHHDAGTGSAFIDMLLGKCGGA